MTKKDVIREMAKKMDMTQSVAAKALNAFTESIVEGVKSGNRILITGFGVFEIHNREGRTGLHPLTGEAIEIKPSKILKFKPGSALKTELNS